jgi:hypothetical protein
MEKFELPCEKEYDKDLFEYRAIDRYVWYQIRKMVEKDVQVGRILKIDNDGILRVNSKSRLITAEQKDTIGKLIANQRDGIYRAHQFEDLNEKITSQAEYNKWFDEKAMNSFMYTVPTKEVFYSHPVKLYYKLVESHSGDERNRQGFSGYSIWQTIYALDMIDPFLVGMILSGNISIEIKDYTTYIRFNYDKKTLYGINNSIDLYEKDKNGNFVKSEDTIHTLLFRHYQEPIYKVINSIMLPIGGYRVLPSEGLGNDPRIEELTDKANAILESENYKTLTKKYNIGKSKVSRVYY